MLNVHLSETANCPDAHRIERWKIREIKWPFFWEVPVVSLIYSGGEGAETEYTGRYQICLRLWEPGPHGTPL